MRQLAPCRSTDQRRIGKRSANSSAECARDDAAVNPTPRRIFQRSCVACVSGESFVGAFTSQNHFDSLVGELRYEIQWNARGPDDRLIFMPDQERQCIEEVLLTDEDLMVGRIQVVGDDAGVRQLAVLIL